MHWENRCLPGISRREMLWRCANGFGGLALSCLLAEKQGLAAGPSTRPLAPRDHSPPAQEPESVIFLFMDGGPSQMDTFDPKPRLQKESGQPIRMETPATVFQISRMVLGSPFSFKRYGHSGAAVSELFPPPGHLRG